MSVSSSKIELLYKVEKICTEEIKWRNTIPSRNDHMKFNIPVITTDGEMLAWIAYYQNKYGQKRIWF